MSVRVRFAPSPTGKVHIGNIRTAIFNYLFARHHGGEFLLRIEDTDLERSTGEAIDALLECMAYLRLDYDGEIFYQSRQADRHRAAAEQLIRKHQAYYGAPDEAGRRPVFFRIPVHKEPDGGPVRIVGAAEIPHHAETPVVIDHTGISYAALSPKGKGMPAVSCLSGMRDLELFSPGGERLFSLAPELPKVLAGEVSFRIENAGLLRFTRREIAYADLVKGVLAKPLDGLKDLIIVRSDGSPVFHLGNVLDDIEQGVTHIIRGDDHVENTFRHLFLFRAFDYPLPAYAHLPMIVNREGKPYSKRDGDAFVGDFRTRGFLPEALFNYLALLGWSPGDDREKLSVPEMIAAFTLDRVKSAPAQFDLNKLSNLNGLYLAALSPAEFVAIAAGYFPEAAQLDRFTAVMELMQSRTKVLEQVRNFRYFFFDDFEYDEKNCHKQLTRPEVRDALGELGRRFAAAADFSAETIGKIIGEAEKEFGFENNKLFQPLRLAATGAAGGAELDRTLELIGREPTVKRLAAALDRFEAR